MEIIIFVGIVNRWLNRWVGNGIRIGGFKENFRWLQKC